MKVCWTLQSHVEYRCQTWIIWLVISKSIYITKDIIFDANSDYMGWKAVDQDERRQGQGKSGFWMDMSCLPALDGM